jgi:hypothetical protein
MIVCTLDVGRTLYTQVIILQITGGMTIVTRLSVSYHLCQYGEYEDPNEPHLACMTCPPNTYSNTFNAGQCTPCPPGFIAPNAGASTCMACLPGQFFNGTGICRPCAAGYYTAVSAQLACLPCIGGQVNEVPGMSVCINCPMGKAYKSPTTCDSCPPGLYASVVGSTACVPCSPKTYSPVAGALTCLSCPTNSDAPIGMSACSCLSGYYFHNGSCIICPNGANCASSSDPLRNLISLASEPGYWRLLDDEHGADTFPPQFYVCPLGAAACLGSYNGTCAIGYQGPTCAFCQLGYHLDETSCDVCQGGTKFMLPIVIVVAIAAGALFYFVASKFNTKKVVGVVQVLVGYFQVMGSSNSAVIHFQLIDCHIVPV